MRVVIATVVHHPDDARIRYRQIPAILDEGHTITYIAPAGDASAPPAGVRRVVVPRSVGRNRVASLRAMAAALRAETPVADITVIHDPELTLIDRAINGPVVWDVHEDVVAQLEDKSYLPSLARPAARLLARSLERRGRRRLTCIIAESGYAPRFPAATLVRNTVRFPETVVESGDSRLVYLGRVSKGRGANILASVGAALPPGRTLEIIGPADPGLAELEGQQILVRGFVPNDRALALLEGAAVGFSLLRNLPNYRHSLPTKILEYLAHGVPVVSTPLPEAVALIEGHDCGIVVPFDDPVATQDAALRLLDNRELRLRYAENGRRLVREHYNWDLDARRLTSALRLAAGRR